MSEKGIEDQLLSIFSGSEPKRRLEAVAFLRDPDKCNRLADELEATAERRPVVEPRANPRAEKRPPGEQAIERQAETDVEAAVRLRALRDALVAKEALPTIRDLRAFAEDAALDLPQSGGRHQLIARLIRGLSEMDREERSHAFDLFRRERVSDDRSLEGWTRVIMSESDS